MTLRGVTLQEPIELPTAAEDDDLHPLQQGKATKKGAHRHHGHLTVAGTSREPPVALSFESPAPGCHEG
jgi:hypothetical protein